MGTESSFPLFGQNCRLSSTSSLTFKLTQLKDVPALIRYQPRQAAHHVPHHSSTYRLATLLTFPLIFSLLLFWAITHGSVRAVQSWEILPQSYLVFLAICFALPLQRLSRSGRYHFLDTLKRVSVGGLAEPQDGKFGDILLADVLTSYAKVLGDLFVSICMLFSKGVSSTSLPNRGCGGAYMVPLIISIPSIIRLRQCLIEFVRVQNGRQTSHGWGGQHLANALKYASAFPVIALSALQRGYDPAKIHMTEAGLFRLWSDLPMPFPNAAN
jgi:EXS family